jgi:SPOR domain
MDLGRCFCPNRLRATPGPETTSIMADDSRFRPPRPGESYRRVAAEPLRASEHESDPLAELARLIGKNDPYAEFGLNTSRSSEPRERYSRDAPAAPAPSGYDDPRRRTHEAASHEEAQQPYDKPYEEPYREPYAEPYRDSRGGRGLESYGASRESYRSDQDFEPTQDFQLSQHERLDQWRHDDQPSPPAPLHPAPLHDDEGHAEYADAEPYHDEDAQEAGHYGDDEASLDPQLEQLYDDPPHPRRRGGLATALALIGCAMLGTAGAYAYRSFHSQPALAGPPPVITADNSTPTKIVPAPAGDSQFGKIIQDRLAAAGREQIVSTQEEPVAEKDLGTQAVPRVVLPAPVAPAPAAPQRAPAAAQQTPLGAGAPAASEPRKVRTVTIRPDGTEAAPSAAPSVARGVSPAAARAPSGGPLSLDPQAREPVAAPSAKPRVAAAPAATNSGSEFLVQLSSQKSEAEAAASFRSLQAKFPDEIGGRSPIIRRADLGSKGVFYRTMVGPFASAQEASQFCASFKAAGGHCVVPSN